MHTITTVIFDLGRVLVNIDFDAFPNALGLVSAEARLPFRREVARLAHLFETGKSTTDEFVDGLYAVFNGAYTREHLLFAWNEIIREDVPGMAQLVERVQRHAATAILSNTSTAHFEKAERESPTVGTITRRFLSYELGEAKPSPEIYRRVIDGLGAPASRLLFIDDLVENVDAARDAGMHGLVFTDPLTLERDLLAWNVLPPTSPE